MIRISLILLLLGGCEIKAPNPENSCREFSYTTTRNGRFWNCQMLWCETFIGSDNMHASGMSTLWCEEK